MRATPRGISKILALALFASIPAASEAREIHLDCARTGQTVAVDVDTDRRFLQMMWGQGVAQEFLNGDSYVSGPDAFGETEKVTYVLNVDKEIVSFGEDRVLHKERRQASLRQQGLAQHAGRGQRRTALRGWRQDRDSAMPAGPSRATFLRGGGDAVNSLERGVRGGFHRNYPIRPGFVIPDSRRNRRRRVTERRAARHH